MTTAPVFRCFVSLRAQCDRSFSFIEFDERKIKTVLDSNNQRNVRKWEKKHTISVTQVFLTQIQCWRRKCFDLFGLVIFELIFILWIFIYFSIPINCVSIHSICSCWKDAAADRSVIDRIKHGWSTCECYSKCSKARFRPSKRFAIKNTLLTGCFEALILTIMRSTKWLAAGIIRMCASSNSDKVLT